MSNKKFILTLLISVLVLILTGGARADTVTDCGTISASGYYELDRNITSANTCLTITVSNVEVDCKGHTVEYANTGTATRFGIDVVLGTMPLENITIRNCLVQKTNSLNTAGYGIRMQRISDSNIINNTINTNGTTNNYGLYLLTTNNNNLIENNTINSYGTSTGNIGIYLSSDSNYNIIRNNKVNSVGTTTSYALYMYYDSNYNLIDNNNFSTISNAGSGNTDSNTLYFYTSKYNNVTNNYIYSEGYARDYAVYLRVHSRENHFINNTIVSVNTAGTSYGVYSIDSALNYYEGNNITLTGTATIAGIYLGRSNFNSGDNNSISVLGTTQVYGIYVANSYENNFDNGNYYVNGTTANYVIYLNNGDDNQITNSFINITGKTVTNYGVYAFYANRNLIENNSIYTSGGTNGNPSIALSTCKENIVNGNNLSSSGSGTTNYGVYVLTAESNNITNNYITTDGTTKNYGVFLSTNAHDNFVDNNIILPGGTITLYGVYLFTLSSENTVSNNYIFSNGSTQSGTTNNWGVYLATNSNDNLIENNTVITGGGTPNYGIYLLTDSDRNTIRGNNISTSGSGANNHGIYISNSNDNLAESNIISASGSATSHGFYIYRSALNNTLNNNIISASGSTNSHGIDLIASSPNFPYYTSISKNTFLSVSGRELNIETAGIDYLFLINQPLDSYLFTGAGSLATIEKLALGKISFLSGLTGSGTGFSDSINISENYVYVDSSVSGFNKSAEITIYNRSTTRTNLGVYMDGVLCSPEICTNLTSMQAGNVTFNVTGGAYYSINSSDEIPHNVSLLAPANDINITTQTYDFNFTVTDETSALFKCYVYIDDELYGSNESVLNSTETSITTSGINGGSHEWYISCLDEGNWSQNSETRLMQNNIPIVIYNSPENNSFINNEDSVLLNYTISDSETSIFDVWVYGDGSLINNDPGVSLGEFTYNWTGLSIGQHNWSVVANDGFSNSTEQLHVFNFINLTLNCEAGGPYQSGALVLIQGNISDGISLLQSQDINLSIYDSANGLVTSKNISSDSSGNFQTSFSNLVAGNYTLNSSSSYQGINISCTDNLVIGGGALTQLDKIISFYNITNTSVSYNISLKSSNLGNSDLNDGNLVDSDSEESPYSLGTITSGSSTLTSYIRTYTRNSTTYNSTLAIATLNGTDSYSGNEVSVNSTEIDLIIPSSDLEQQLTLIKNAYFNSENSTSVNYSLLIEVVNSGGEDLTGITVIDSDLDVNELIALNRSQLWNYTDSLIFDKEASNSEKTFAKSSATVNLITYQSNQIKINIPGYGGPADTYVYAPSSTETSTSFDSTIEIINQNPDIGQNFVIDYWITNEEENTNYSSGQSTTYVSASRSTNITISLVSPSSVGNYRLRVLTSYIGGPDTAYDSFIVTDSSSGEETGSEGSSSAGGGGSVTGRATEEIVCNTPYMRYGKECCLDKNNNSVCDNDEVSEDHKENKTETSNEEQKDSLKTSTFISKILSKISEFLEPSFDFVKQINLHVIIIFGGLIFIILLLIIILRISRKIKKRYGKNNHCKGIKELINKKVYTDSGDYLGEIREVILGEKKIDSLKIKIHKKFKINSKGIIVKWKEVVNCGEIVIINKRVLEHINNPPKIN